MTHPLIAKGGASVPKPHALVREIIVRGCGVRERAARAGGLCARSGARAGAGGCRPRYAHPTTAAERVGPWRLTGVERANAIDIRIPIDRTDFANSRARLIQSQVPALVQDRGGSGNRPGVPANPRVRRRAMPRNGPGPPAPGLEVRRRAQPPPVRAVESRRPPGRLPSLDPFAWRAWIVKAQPFGARAASC